MPPEKLTDSGKRFEGKLREIIGEAKKSSYTSFITLIRGILLYWLSQ